MRKNDEIIRFHRKWDWNWNESIFIYDIKKNFLIFVFDFIDFFWWEANIMLVYWLATSMSIFTSAVSLWDENVLEGNVIGWWDWMRCSLTWWLSYEDIQNWMLYAERKNIIIFSPSFVDENVKALGKILNIDQKKFFYSYIVVFFRVKVWRGNELVHDFKRK